MKWLKGMRDQQEKVLREHRALFRLFTIGMRWLVGLFGVVWISTWLYGTVTFAIEAFFSDTPVIMNDQPLTRQEALKYFALFIAMGLVGIAAICLGFLMLRKQEAWLRDGGWPKQDRPT